MSFLDSLSKGVGYAGRGLEDLFTLGGTEIARNNGGKFGNKFFNVLDKGFGSNFAAGAAGGLSYLGGSGLASALSGSGSGTGASVAGPTSLMGGTGDLGGASYGLASGPLDLTPAYGSATGAGAGSSFSGVSSPSLSGPSSSLFNKISKFSRLNNSLSGGGGGGGNNNSSSRGSPYDALLRSLIQKQNAEESDAVDTLKSRMYPYD